MVPIRDELELAGAAVALGAPTVAGWSPAERRLAARGSAPPVALLRQLRRAIRDGGDPLGDALCRLRPSRERRALGATYTPPGVVDAMIEWGAAVTPARVVDPGTGSGRFLVAAGRRLPTAELVGIELDPLAALLARAHLVVAGLGRRARIELGDYRACRLPRIGGRTLFLGNPPYVRHHAIDPRWKRWLVERARALGLRASQLAGLHVHFLLATVGLSAPGDRGALLTAAEWLDVNYGRLVRELLLGPLGGLAVHLVTPTERVFADADVSAAILCFELGARPAGIALRPVPNLAALAPLSGGTMVPRARLAAATRWSSAATPGPTCPPGMVELGELCRVHRGQVTGRNATWIVHGETPPLPARFLFPTVTRAQELFRAGGELTDPIALRRVVDLPADLDALAADERRLVERFLRFARAEGADGTYIARARHPWWCVRLREPAPILATYMARRPPAFVRNRVGARHVNVVHGLYPRAGLTEAMLDGLARFLAGNTDLSLGRTYAGGLTKFEPRELERVRVPAAEHLAALAR
jgi:adenine-specific DNA-methyltransferase